MAHTKGKWFASAQGVTENTLERKVLIAFEYGIEFGNAADDMALINAAPDMYEALNIAHARLRRLMKNYRDTEENQIISSALNKAEGIRQ